MNKSGCSCGSVAAAIFFIYAIGQVFSQAQTNPGNAFLLAGAMILLATIVIWVAVSTTKKARVLRVDAFQQTANTIQRFIDTDAAALTKDIGAKGETDLFELPNIQLMEYKSNGTEYVAGHAGISFPIVGRVRGYAGGTRGESIKKPEVLTEIDKGKVRISNERIIFIGEKETDEWKFEKLVDAQAGDNGLWIKLASSGRTKNAFLQHTSHDQLPIAMAIGIASEWAKGGQAPAVEYAKGMLGQINQAVAEAQTKVSRSKR